MIPLGADGQVDTERFEAAIRRLPIVVLLGLDVRVTSPREVECTIPVIRPEHLGGLETQALNGGVILAMLDAVTVVAGMLQFPHEVCGTSELRVRFRRPVPPAGFRVSGRVTRTTERRVFVESEIRGADGSPRVLADGAVARIGPRPGAGSS